MSVIVEIRAAEGGDDAKDLVGVQFAIYARYAGANGCSVQMHEYRPGLCVFEVAALKPVEEHVPTGLFRGESGGHRWQRVPPSEKRGRVHTSTVTVAVLPVTHAEAAKLDEREIEYQATRGSGAGGQARNKTSNAVIVKHVPSGLTVRVESERSQWQNRVSALRIIAARLADRARREQGQATAASRRRQVGSGMRGDKIRTVRVRDDRVKDHRTGKQTTLSRYSAGHVGDLR